MPLKQPEIAFVQTQKVFRQSRDTTERKSSNYYDMQPIIYPYNQAQKLSH